MKPHRRNRHRLDPSAPGRNSSAPGRNRSSGKSVSRFTITWPRRPWARAIRPTTPCRPDLLTTFRSADRHQSPRNRTRRRHSLPSTLRKPSIRTPNSTHAAIRGDIAPRVSPPSPSCLPSRRRSLPASAAPQPSAPAGRSPSRCPAAARTARRASSAWCCDSITRTSSGRSVSALASTSTTARTPVQLASPLTSPSAAAGRGRGRRRRQVARDQRAHRIRRLRALLQPVVDALLVHLHDRRLGARIVVAEDFDEASCRARRANR